MPDTEWIEIFHPETGDSGRTSRRAFPSLQEKGWVEGTADTHAALASQDAEAERDGAVSQDAPAPRRQPREAPTPPENPAA